MKEMRATVPSVTGAAPSHAPIDMKSPVLEVTVPHLHRDITHPDGTHRRRHFRRVGGP